MGSDELGAWQSAVAGRVDPVECLQVKGIKGQSDRGGSGTFLVEATDERDWWVKPLNNGQSRRVCVNEQVVGGAGALIGAPVCTVAVIEITPVHAGWEFRAGKRTEPGFASASLDVTGASELPELTHRSSDDNRRRHSGVFALYDWCFGSSDHQWLFKASDDQRTYSHDHGHYFPSGPDWTTDSLEASRDEAHPLNMPKADLHADALEERATALESLDVSSLGPILKTIPASWPVTDEDLCSLGAFLLHRARPVAARLRALPS